jgi:hypothetical protein
MRIRHVDQRLVVTCFELVNNVLDALAAMYTAAAPENEFWLLTGDADATPPQRMAYRSPSELD